MGLLGAPMEVERLMRGDMAGLMEAAALKLMAEGQHKDSQANVRSDILSFSVSWIF